MIGRGGNGLVYKAMEQKLERLVALKVLHSEYNQDKQYVARFLREGHILCSLTHPHITTFFRVGQWQGQLYMAMEYIDGTSLLNVINERPMDWNRALHICMQICDAMSHAHTNGMLHRDLTPYNVLISAVPEADTVKIIDFGLGKGDSKAEAQKLTQTGELIGSIYYMSPEQCQGEPADNRSDIYAAGCILYACLTGRHPLLAENVVALMFKHMYEGAQPLAESFKEQPWAEKLDRIVSKAMAKSPEDRYQSLDELRCELLAVRNGGRIQADTLSNKRSRKLTAKQLLPPLAVTVAAIGGISLLLPGTLVATFLPPDNDSTLSRNLALARFLSEHNRRDEAETLLASCAQFCQSDEITSPTEVKALTKYTMILAANGKTKPASDMAIITLNTFYRFIRQSYSSQTSAESLEFAKLITREICPLIPPSDSLIERARYLATVLEGPRVSFCDVAYDAANTLYSAQHSKRFAILCTIADITQKEGLSSRTRKYLEALSKLKIDRRNPQFGKHSNSVYLALISASMTARKIGDNAVAAKLILSAIASRSLPPLQSIELQLNAAALLMSSGRFAFAERVLQQTLSEVPTGNALLKADLSRQLMTAKLKRADALYQPLQKNDVQSAYQMYLQLIDDPSCTVDQICEAYLGFMRTCLFLHRCDMGVQRAPQGLAKIPKDKKYWPARMHLSLQLAQCLMSSKDRVPQAIANLNQLLQELRVSDLEPDFKNERILFTLMLLSSSQLSLENWPEVLRLTEEMSKVPAPKRMDYRREIIAIRASALCHVNRTNEAIEQLRKTILVTTQPHYLASLYTALGDCYRKDSNAPKAKTALEAALSYARRSPKLTEVECNEISARLAALK